MYQVLRMLRDPFSNGVTVPQSMFSRDALFCPSLKVLYPIMMVTAVWRTIKIRIHPDSVLVFNHYEGEAETDTAGITRRALVTLKTSVVDDHSLFSWADRGEWETAGSEDPQRVREADWFRIGFEPIFVDYTKSGTNIILICLGKVSARHERGARSLSGDTAVE